VALAAVAAGCGDGGGDTASSTQPTVTSSAAQPGPDGLERVVSRCQASSARSSSPEVVPAEFRPAHARVVSAERRDNGFEARLLYDRSVTQVYDAVKSAATAAGYEVSREENEGRDAELFLERDGQPTEVRLAALRACPQYASATVESGGR
jgi:hypothetical protein